MSQRFVRKPTGTGDRHFVSQPTRQPGRYEHTLSVHNRASIRHLGIAQDSKVLLARDDH